MYFSRTKTNTINTHANFFILFSVKCMEITANVGGCVCVHV